MRKIAIIACLSLFGATGIVAQRLDHFDLLLFSLRQKPDSNWEPYAPRFLTAFNAAGYNNQPQFFSPNELYLTVQLPSDTTQTEIYALNLSLRTTSRVTATKTAEYSPTPLPGGKRFSAIRVEESGAQRLWSFPLDRSDKGRPEFPQLTNVGYHCWLRDTLAALFLVGENDAPHALAIAGVRRQQIQRIAFNVGRCLQKTPDGRLAFVHKATDQTWYIKTYDPERGGVPEILIKTLPGSEDFVVLADGTYLAGQGPKLFQFHPQRQKDWTPVADLSRHGVKSVTRLAVSTDGKLAVVVQ